MTRIESIIALLKANTGADTVAPSLIASYANLAETTTLETISSTIMAGSILKPGFEIAPAADVIEQMFISLFGYSQTEMDELRATEAGAAGFQYWVDELNNNVDIINVNTLAIALLNGAAEADQAKAAALVADELAAYEAYAGETPEEPEVVGEIFELTSGTDKGAAFVGTINNDFYDASIAQNSFTGGVSNTLSSADKLDGGAGTDTLHAEIVAEFVGATAWDYQIDVQPQTKDIEIVTFEARDSGSNDGAKNVTVTVDAKYMYGVEKIGSKFSDGDLVIENLTTLADNGTTIRNTSDMTITMDHTDDMNSDGDASDLTVLFDEDYLVTGQQTAGASLTIRLLNAVQNEAGNNSVEGFSKISFYVGTKLVTVDITSVANDNTQDFTTAYDAIVDLINAELTAQGLTSVSASISTLADAVFSIPVAGFDVGDSAGQYYPIVVTNSGSEALTKSNIETYGLNYDTDLNNSFTATAATTSVTPLSVDIELTKVGRDGEGGNLIVGAKGLDSKNVHNTDVDLTDGINVFNITVFGDEDLPSNLGVIQSTNDHLTTVNITSETRTDGSYAALTVRGQAAGDDVFNSDDSRPFGGTLDTLNADKFKGDLRIGEVTAALNIDTFTAMGGGDIYLNQEIFAGATEDGATTEFDSLDANEFTIDTGAGADEIIVVATDGAQLDVNTGAGADEITVTINGQDDSGSDFTFATIVSGDGDDTVTVTSSDSTHEADIFTGAGNDTIYGNSVNITVEAGSGNDTIYTNNTATKAIIINTVANNTLAGTATSIAGTSGAPATPDTAELLFGRSVVVTLATEGIGANDFTQGFESISVDIVASNGYLTTTADLHTAIAKAINTDPVLSKLAEAEVDSNGTLTVSYLIDGVVDVSANAAVAYKVSGVWSDLNPTEQNNILAQLEEQYTNSDLILANLGTAYNTAAITTAKAILDNGTGTDGVDSTDGENNTVNAGLGNDVIVLSSDDDAIDTIEIDANGFGNDTIVHFEDGAAGDIFDFSHLNNVTSLSGSTVSQIDVAGTVATATTITANSLVQVALTDLTDNDAHATSAMTFDTLTNTGVLNEINAATDFGITATLPANLVGNLVNSIFMIEDDANAGYYKVYEVVYNTTSNTFTEATLVGTLDFEQSVTLVNDNIA